VKEQGAPLRDKILTSTEAVFGMAAIPLIDITVNALNKNKTFRKVLDSGFGVYKEAPIPEFDSNTLRKRVAPVFRDILNQVQSTKVDAIERCSGHDGTYAVKTETHEKSVKMAPPVVRKVDQQDGDHFSSGYPMAGRHIANLSDKVDKASHPMTLEHGRWANMRACISRMHWPSNSGNATH
jgi:hypothetical protein